VNLTVRLNFRLRMSSKRCTMYIEQLESEFDCTIKLSFRYVFKTLYYVHWIIGEWNVRDSAVTYTEIDWSLQLVFPHSCPPWYKQRSLVLVSTFCQGCLYVLPYTRLLVLRREGGQERKREHLVHRTTLEPFSLASEVASSSVGPCCRHWRARGKIGLQF